MRSRYYDDARELSAYLDDLAEAAQIDAEETEHARRHALETRLAAVDGTPVELAAYARLCETPEPSYWPVGVVPSRRIGKAGE